MNIIEILSAGQTCIQVNCDSKKSVLEKLSQVLTQSTQTITQKEVFNSLIEREKLGSTGIGFGVAIPHARIEGIHKPIGALLQLRQPISFDAPDEEGVDLLFGLLMPMDCTEEQIKVLGALAELFSSQELREKLRAAHDNNALYRIATGKSE